MTGNAPQCGDVISIFDYGFSDGSTADSKYFVVMGSRGQNTVGFLTTSKEKCGRKRLDGCSPSFTHFPTSFYLKTKGSPFAAGTWVLLQIEEHETASLIQKLNDGKAVRALTLPMDTVRALRNCFEKSLDWAPGWKKVLCG